MILTNRAYKNEEEYQFPEFIQELVDTKDCTKLKEEILTTEKRLLVLMEIANIPGNEKNIEARKNYDHMEDSLKKYKKALALLERKKELTIH